jgi:pyruvate,water dikinase
MNAIYRQSQASPNDPIGGKASALAALQHEGFHIPPWFAIAAEAFAGNSESEVPRLPDAIRASLPDAVREICPGNELVAVRSSAIDEDGFEHSFAGQLQSFLSVEHGEIPEKAFAVARSAGGRSVNRYRQEHGLDASMPGAAVLVQRMVDARISGVAFGRDPVNGTEDAVVIAAVDGLGDRLVSGELNGSTIAVDSEGTVTRRGSADLPAIPTDQQAREIASLTRKAGAFFRRPQDVEWAISREGKLYLLQSRPITTINSFAASERIVWDNSNIVESYRGITTPLTFTFARRAYEGVYREFCRILSVPKKTLEAHGATFANMLGQINGRIYYNLVSWNQVLAMLPGYRLNRGFMEQMMGVKEPMPSEIAKRIEKEASGNRLIDALRLTRSLGSLFLNYALLGRHCAKFQKRFESAMVPPSIPLEEMSLDELGRQYRNLEDQLLTRWDAPLLNDFFCMIQFGLLQKLAARWCPGEKDIHLALLSGSGEMISAEPAARLRDLATIARQQPSLADTLLKGTTGEIEDAMVAHPEFDRALKAYLDKFGERCLEELKLESPTLHDDATTLFWAIGQLARNERPAKRSGLDGTDANQRLMRSLAKHPLRRAIFQRLLRQTRQRLRQRENLRFERTRLFGRIRRIFVELGKRLQLEGRLEKPRDIFYLEIDEALAAASGENDPNTGPDFLKIVVARRKQEEERYRLLPAPPSRFETQGKTDCYVAPDQCEDAPADNDDARRSGLGCSAGQVQGVVRVIRDPRGAELKQGEILVAESTDPGWIMLFPLASAIIVERGSPLSHSAIVARELGIPAVVALEGATDWLRDGDQVHMDGSSGVVRKLKKSPNRP